MIIIIYDLSSPIEKNKQELSLFSRFFFFGRQIDLDDDDDVDDRSHLQNQPKCEAVFLNNGF
jgi:hypothetical protein